MDACSCTLVAGEFVKVPGARSSSAAALSGDDRPPLLPAEAGGDHDAAGLGPIMLDHAAETMRFASPRPTPPPSRGHDRPRFDVAPTVQAPAPSSTPEQRHLNRRKPTTLGEACDGADLPKEAGRELEMEVCLHPGLLPSALGYGLRGVSMMTSCTHRRRDSSTYLSSTR